MAGAAGRQNDFHVFEPYDCTPGEKWEAFLERLMNYCTNQVDDRGFSIADHILDIDEGGAAPGAFPMPPQPAELRKATFARNKRIKRAYGIITQHITDPDHITTIRQNHFQDGQATFNYLTAHCQLAMTQSRLRELDTQWNALDLLTDVGVSENTVLDLVKKIKVMNSKRPFAQRKTNDQMAERVLELIMDTSKHFQETTTTEYNAPVGSRRFEFAAPHPLAGQRDLVGLSQHYHNLWKAAVESKLPGFSKRGPTQKPVVPTRNTLEAGMLLSHAHDFRAHDSSIESMLQAEAGSENYFVPRPGSPTPSLAYLAKAGDDVASRRGTTTTTDWSALSQQELEACANACYECTEIGVELDRLALNYEQKRLFVVRQVGCRENQRGAEPQCIGDAFPLEKLAMAI